MRKDIDYNVPLYDPYRDPGENYYLPDNEAAKHLVYILHIYNISCLTKMLSAIPTTHEKKLIVKYMVVEFLSMDEHIRKLKNLILSGQREYPLNDTSRKELKSLYANYQSTLKQELTFLQNVRDKIAAHRDLLELPTVASIWGSLDSICIIRALNTVPSLFNFMNRLNVYRWTKTEYDEDGHKVVPFIQPLSIHSNSHDV